MGLQQGKLLHHAQKQSLQTPLAKPGEVTPVKVRVPLVKVRHAVAPFAFGLKPAHLGSRHTRPTPGSAQKSRGLHQIFVVAQSHDAVSGGIWCRR